MVSPLNTTWSSIKEHLKTFLYTIFIKEFANCRECLQFFIRWHPSLNYSVYVHASPYKFPRADPVCTRLPCWYKKLQPQIIRCHISIAAHEAYIYILLVMSILCNNNICPLIILLQMFSGSVINQRAHLEWRPQTTFCVIA